MTIEQARNAAPSTAFDERDENLVRYLGLNPNSPADRAMVAVARHYDLDPLLKHVVVIPKGGVYLTRDGLLHIAHRSGQLDGIVVEQEPRLSDDGSEWVCRVSVYRKDMSHPFTFPGRYPVNGGNKAYAQEMSLKSAESHAMRRAFDINGIPVYDEQRPEAQQRPDGGERASGADRMRGILGQDGPTQADAPAPAGAADNRFYREPQESAPAAADVVEPEGITAAQLKKMGAAMREAGLTERAAALDFVAGVIGREINSRNDLTKDEATRVIDRLERNATAVDAPAASDDVVDGEVVEERNPNEVWADILRVAESDHDWDQARVRADFLTSFGFGVEEASGDELHAYLVQLQTGEAVSA